AGYGDLDALEEPSVARGRIAPAVDAVVDATRRGRITEHSEPGVRVGLSPDAHGLAGGRRRVAHDGARLAPEDRDVERVVPEPRLSRIRVLEVEPARADPGFELMVVV